MDIPISKTKKAKWILVSRFQTADLIPYTIALLMVAGNIYFVFLFRYFLLSASR